MKRHDRGLRRPLDVPSRCLPPQPPEVVAAARATGCATPGRARGGPARHRDGGDGAALGPPRYLAMPVLLIVGEGDTKFRAIAGAMALVIPDAELAVIPGVGTRGASRGARIRRRCNWWKLTPPSFRRRSGLRGCSLPARPSRAVGDKRHGWPGSPPASHCRAGLARAHHGRRRPDRHPPGSGPSTARLCALPSRTARTAASPSSPRHAHHVPDRRTAPRHSRTSRSTCPRTRSRRAATGSPSARRSCRCPATSGRYIDFSFWNARALYFEDADANVLELIARHDLPNASDGVGPRSLLGSPRSAARVPTWARWSSGSRRSSGCRYSGDRESFAAVGDGATSSSSSPRVAHRCRPTRRRAGTRTR